MFSINNIKISLSGGNLANLSINFLTQPITKFPGELGQGFLKFLKEAPPVNVISSISHSCRGLVALKALSDQQS